MARLGKRPGWAVDLYFSMGRSARNDERRVRSYDVGDVEHVRRRHRRSADRDRGACRIPGLGGVVKHDPRRMASDFAVDLRLQRLYRIDMECGCCRRSRYRACRLVYG